MNASSSKEELEMAQGALKNFPTLEAYANKRKGDFPRLATRQPSPY